MYAHGSSYEPATATSSSKHTMHSGGAICAGFAADVRQEENSPYAAKVSLIDNGAVLFLNNTARESGGAIALMKCSSVVTSQHRMVVLLKSVDRLMRRHPIYSLTVTSVLSFPVISPVSTVLPYISAITSTIPLMPVLFSKIISILTPLKPQFLLLEMRRVVQEALFIPRNHFSF